jgi:hypothetical protein
MEKQTFTQGPWEVDSTGYRAAGNGLCVMAWHLGKCVAVTGAHNSDMPVDANAALIAAAPDLYEALKEIIDTEWIGGKGGFVKARAALAKARGEA